MKKLIVGLLLLTSLQIVRGQETPKTAQSVLVGVQFGGFSSLASSANSEKDMTMAMGIPSSKAKTYYKGLKHGWSFGGDIYLMGGENFGIGAKYTFYSSGTSQDFIIKIPATLPEYIYMGMEEKVYINYVGPSIIFRQWLGENRKLQFTESLSAGRVSYRDELRIDPASFPLMSNALAKGNTYGINLGMSFDYYPLSWLSIGANIGLMNASLSSVEVSSLGTKQTLNLGKDNKESLARFDYSLGVRFYF